MGTVTRTVVFTDLANYTAKVSRGGRQDLLRILEEHEALVTPIIEKYGGRVVKNLGDAFMCLFNAATPALRAALDIQALVVGEGTNPIRLAMTTGDMEDIEGDAFGEAVNLSARILSKTPAGEVWFGAGTGLCIYSAEIPWESVGRFRLKGIPGERELFRAVPAHRCWLPDPVLQAARRGTLVHLEQGQRPPLLPPDPVVLLKGFVPGSKELGAAVALLPVVAPACLWLSTYNIAAEDRIRWTEEGRGLVVGTPEALEEAIQDASKVLTRPMGSDTIILDLGADVDIELVMCGLALPSVPFSEVVSSYSYDLLADGRWANQSDRAVLRVEVGASGTSLRGLSPGVTVNGRSVGSEDRVELEDGAQVRCSAGTLEFRRLDRGYAGMMLLDSDMRLGVTAGQVAGRLVLTTTETTGATGIASGDGKK